MPRKVGSYLFIFISIICLLGSPAKGQAAELPVTSKPYTVKADEFDGSSKTDTLKTQPSSSVLSPTQAAAMNARITINSSPWVYHWMPDETSVYTSTSNVETVINGSNDHNQEIYDWYLADDPLYDAGLQPGLPSSPVPADDATNINLLINNSVSLQATVTDADSSSLTVSFYGRPYCTSPTFTVVALPDTQYYCSQTNGGTRAMFDSQTQWIVANHSARNIVFTTHLGDIVDTASDIAQWDIAGSLTEPKGALTLLDEAGLKYGLNLGNHDGSPSDTGNFNSYFPFSRVGNGHFGTDNDNSYSWFSKFGMDFIVIQIEEGANNSVRSWANDLLSVDFPNHRAIVVTHNLLSGSTSPASFTTEGQALYNALKTNPNLFLMLGGHQDTEVSRSDTYNGHTVYSLRSDYQGRSGGGTGGGNGWMRLLEFQPSADRLQVYTYSPFLNQWERDADSQFALPYEMDGSSCAPFQLIQTLPGVLSDTSPSVTWPNRAMDTQYEWYVTVDDGDTTAYGPIWSFTTESNPNAPIANFSGTPTSGIAPLTVGFTNSSTGTFNTCSWSFGDGASSTQCTSPSHTYNAPGIYDVALAVTGPGGSNTLTKSGYIIVYAPVNASFSASPTSGIAPLNVGFTNSSTGNYSTCTWAFGDGATSTQCIAPSHTYSTPGIYTVSLNVSGPGGTDIETKSNYITVHTPVSANFIGTPTSGVAPLTVSFTNSSTGIISTCSWTFGDGGSSNQCNPSSHIYSTPGVYTVALTVTGPGGSNTLTKSSYITVYTPVSANFIGTPTSGIAPLTVNFINTSSGTFSTCNWNFGDGGTSNICNPPSHIYTTGGSYSVSLTVTGPGGSNTLAKSSYITVYTPVNANFSASPTSGIAPLTVSFTNSSTGNFSTCSWSFGDGLTSAQCIAPNHTYNTPGVYTVALTVSGSGGIDTQTKSKYITVNLNVIADFLGTPVSGAAPLAVTFTNLSTGDFDTCTWTFGDGATSNQCTLPIHTYNTPGVYTVDVTVTGPGGTDIGTKLNYITIYDPAGADFSASATSGIAPLYVTFANLSSGDFSSCNWNFGDGTTYPQCNPPIHSYSTPGIYDVTLIVSGPGGSDTETKLDYITVDVDILPSVIKTFLPLLTRPY